MIISIQKQCTEISIAHRAVQRVVVQAKECTGSLKTPVSASGSLRQRHLPRGGHLSRAGSGAAGEWRRCPRAGPCRGHRGCTPWTKQFRRCAGHRNTLSKFAAPHGGSSETANGEWEGAGAAGASLPVTLRSPRVGAAGTGTEVPGGTPSSFPAPRLCREAPTGLLPWEL